MLRIATGFALLTGALGYRPESPFGYIDLIRPLTFEEQCEEQRILRDLEDEETVHTKKIYRCRNCGQAGHNSQTCLRRAYNGRIVVVPNLRVVPKTEDAA